MGALIFPLVLAQGPSGTDWSKDAFSQNQANYPWYGECWHDNLNSPNDTMSGIGMWVYYDLFDSTPAFNVGSWEFLDEAGYSNQGTCNVKMATPLECSSCVDYGLSTQQYSTYYDYASPVWTTPTGSDHSCWYVDYKTTGNLQDVHSVEGETGAQFYLVNNPTTTWSIYVYSQDPQNQGSGSFTFLTAHQSITYY